MTVGLEDPPHVEALAELEELLVLVRRVEQHRVAGRFAAHDEDVVVDRPHDELVDLDLVVAVVHGNPPWRRMPPGLEWHGPACAP